MNKKYAIITDIHGNLEALTAILEDIKKNNIEEIYCLGDTINIGPNSKECIDLLIENNVKSVLGNHEIYLLRASNTNNDIPEEEKAHYEWVAKTLEEKHINYLKNLPLSYNIEIKYDDPKSNKNYILCHYLINNPAAIYPFEQPHLKDDIELWKKYNSEDTYYIVGHLHESFNENEVEGISGDYIEELETLTNILVLDSAGCTKDDTTSYETLEINKGITLKKNKVKYDRTKFINKITNIDFPDKKNILKYFYGIDN